MPPQSTARVRMSASELDQLWKFTLQLAEESLSVLESELLEYAKSSSFADILVPKAREIVGGLYTTAGARPNMDIPTC